MNRYSRSRVQNSLQHHIRLVSVSIPNPETPSLDTISRALAMLIAGADDATIKRVESILSTSTTIAPQEGVDNLESP